MPQALQATGCNEGEAKRRHTASIIRSSWANQIEASVRGGHARSSHRTACFLLVSASPMGSNYITPEGEKHLRDELNRLWKVERPRVTHEVAEAAAQGDRSENAEYIYGKKKLREIDRRMQYLAHRLDKLTVVREKPSGTDRVFFGAWVRLESDDGEVHQFRIVGPDETHLHEGSISIDSPMARAILRKEVGAEVVVRRPRGDTEFVIVEVRYEPFPQDQ